MLASEITIESILVKSGLSRMSLKKSSTFFKVNYLKFHKWEKSFADVNLYLVIFDKYQPVNTRRINVIIEKDLVRNVCKSYYRLFHYCHS